MSFLISFAFQCCFLISAAQSNAPATSGFQRDLETVIQDYPNNFQRFIGEEIIANPQSTDYASMLVLRGSEDCRITKFPPKSRSKFSFQAVMLTTEDFETAKKTFTGLYHQVGQLALHFGTDATYRLTSNYESPEEEKRFASAVFSPDPAGKEITHLKVELLLEYVLLEWKVKVLIYEKEREDDAPGELKSN